MVLNLSVGISISSSNISSSTHLHSRSTSRTISRASCSFAPALLAAAVIFTSSVPDSGETFSNVPQTLSGDSCCLFLFFCHFFFFLHILVILISQNCAGDDKKPARIQRPRSRKAESCTAKCVGTCIRGGAGSPGEGPLNVRR